MAEEKRYYELLKDPRWQKKRLEIFERNNWECENCGSRDKPLHIHHSYYEKGLAPWEYSDENLHCLCEDCHKKAQDFKMLLQRQIGKLDFADLEQLYGYALGLETSWYPMVVIDVSSYEVAQGVGDCWGLSPEEVISGLQDRQIDGYTLLELTKKKKR